MYESNRAEVPPQARGAPQGNPRRDARDALGRRDAARAADGHAGGDDFDGTLWFFTAHHSSKVSELAQSPRSGPRLHGLVRTPLRLALGARRGRAGPEKARALWSPLYREWFPKGLEDPELVLLKVEVSRAEYWDSPGMLGTVGRILAGFSGEVPLGRRGATEAMHGTVRL